MRARKADGIEIVLEVLDRYGAIPNVSLYGCIVISSISEADYSAQKEVCERGGVDTLLDILMLHSGSSKEACEICCWTLCVILSSQNTHSRFCTDDVLDPVQECCEVYEDPEKILQSLLSLMRGEDQRITDVVARGVCTKEAFPKCKDECRCDEGVYCSECCVQQRAFRCLTCDNDKDKGMVYCEVCWRKDHQGHECEEFFYPVRCSTK